MDGINVRHYALDDLRSLMGYVPQKNVLFSGDVAQNLDWGDESGDEDAWRRALDISCASEFVLEKEGGVHAEVAQGGTNFSGGQRQRLAIARAVMRDAEFYLSDDSFSARDVKGTALRLVGYLKPHALALVGVLVLTLASSLFSVLQPSVTGGITTKLYEGVSSGGSFDWQGIGTLLFVLVGIYVASAGFQALQGVIMNRVTTRVLQGMRDEIDRKVHRLPLDYYDARTSGEMLSVITNDVDMVDGAISRNLTQLVSQLVTVVGIFVMMLRISGVLTAIAVLMVPLSLLASVGVITKSARFFADQQSQLGALNGYIEELYDGQNVVQAFNYQQRATSHFDQLNQTLAATARKASISSGAVRHGDILETGTHDELMALDGRYAALYNAQFA